MILISQTVQKDTQNTRKADYGNGILLNVSSNPDAKRLATRIIST